MTISEIICRLQAVKCEHGDLRVLVADINGDLDLAQKVEISQGDFMPFSCGDEKFVSIE